MTKTEKHRDTFRTGNDAAIDAWLGWLAKHYGPVTDYSLSENGAQTTVIATIARAEEAGS